MGCLPYSTNSSCLFKNRSLTFVRDRNHKSFRKTVFYLKLKIILTWNFIQSLVKIITNFSQNKSRYSWQKLEYLAVSNFLGVLPSYPFISFTVNLFKLLVLLDFFNKESNQPKLSVSNSSYNQEQRKSLTQQNQNRTTFASISTTRFLFFFLHNLFRLDLFTLFASLATADFSSHGLASSATYRNGSS